MVASKFIVLEGLDGSGKTTQCRRLAAALRERGRTVFETREPTNGPWGQRCRQHARGELEATKEEILSWFLNDREDHLDEAILPALERGEIVVCDRYEASTWAYQGALGVNLKDCMSMLKPDIQIYLDVPLAECLRRIQVRSDKERYEKFEFLCDVRDEYSKNKDLVWADGRGTEEEVTERLLGMLRWTFSDI